MLPPDRTQAFSNWVASLQEEGVVIEKKHADDIGAVFSLLQLGQDHFPKFVGGRVAGGAEDVSNFHFFSSVDLYWILM